METAIRDRHSAQRADVLDEGHRSSSERKHGVRAVAQPYSRWHAVPVEEHLLERTTPLRLAYRACEWCAAFVLVVLTSPILVLEAILIRLDSPGPALFWQQRIGRSVVRRGRDLTHRTDLIPPAGGFQPDAHYLVPSTVNFVKFRTMYVDARERFPELYRCQYSNSEEFLNSYYKLDNDPRVTRVGRFFRSTTLDELPNLFLVLTGHMRLVGPRPEGPWLLPYYSPEHMLKFSVSPGVTGLAQSRGRGHLKVGEQIAFDLEYAQRRSVWLDMRILYWTLVSVLRRTGAF